MRISINEDPIDDENYIVVARYDQSQKAADCALVISDLNDVILISEKILADPEFRKLMEGHTKDAAKSIELKALWTAAVIGYTKCFNNGTRLPVKPDIYDPHPGAREAHNYIFDLRNKYIAHSVGALEDSITTITLSPVKTVDRQVLGVGCLLYRQVLPDSENIRTLIKLSNIAKNIAITFLDTLHTEILYLAQHDSIENLYKLPYAQLTAPGIDRMKINRKKS